MAKRKSESQAQILEKLHASTEARKATFKELKKHLVAGFSLDAFPPLSEKTIKEFTMKYPLEFPLHELDQAMREAKTGWERIGRQQADGSCLGNSRSWQYNMINRYGWRDKIEQSVDVSGQVSIAVISYADTKRAESSSQDCDSDIGA